MMRFFAYLVPTKGLEPPTYALRVRCTTNCAKSAFRYQHVYYTAFSKRSNSFFHFSSWICREFDSYKIEKHRKAA